MTRKKKTRSGPPKVADLVAKIGRQYLGELQNHIKQADSLLAAQRISDSGSSLEIGLSEFLGQILPSHVGIGRGHVADRSWEHASEEIDIVLYDRRYAAGLPYVGDVTKPGRHVGLFSSDAVLACIAVTKTLRKTKLKESFKNLATVTELAVPDMENQFHFDLELGGNLKYRQGARLNPILTAVVSYDNEMFTRKVRGQREPAVGENLKKKLSDLSSLNWFRETSVDLIYTIDGTIFLPAYSCNGRPILPESGDWIGAPKNFAISTSNTGHIDCRWDAPVNGANRF